MTDRHDSQHDTPQPVPQAGLEFAGQQRSAALLRACTTNWIHGTLGYSRRASRTMPSLRRNRFARRASSQQAIASLEQWPIRWTAPACCWRSAAASLRNRWTTGKPLTRIPCVPNFSPSSWWGALRHTLIYHPAMSMTVLVVAGFLAGVAGQGLPGGSHRRQLPRALQVTVTTTASTASTAPASSPPRPK